MSSEALTFPLEQVVWRPKVSPWAIAATVSMAAFIEILDTTVAEVALPFLINDASLVRAVTSYKSFFFGVGLLRAHPCAGF
jgi:hypothetical protein